MLEDVEARLRELFARLREHPPRSDEEFRYRVEPLRASWETVFDQLLALLDESDPERDLAAATLHHLARDDDTSRLIEAFRDEDRPESARAEVAQVLAGVAGEQLPELLAPEELARLSALSLDTLLERYQDRAGLAQVVALYRHSSPPDRRALLDALEAATRSPWAAVRLGTALDPLFPEEADPELRQLMVQRLATRAESSSAAALLRWVSHSRGEERRRIKEALRRVARHGIRAPAREGTVQAWLSGVDGTGCYSVGLSFPTALGLRDVLLACVGLDAGLRSVNVLPAVESGAVTEIRDSLEDGQSIPVVTVEPSLAFRHVNDARRRSEELGRPLPPGYAAAAPYLERPLGAVASEPGPEAPDDAATGAADTLLEHPAYGSWLFFAGEIPPRTTAAVHEVLLAPVEAHARPGSLDRRLRLLALRALDDLDRSRSATRLIRMLRHQAIVHRLRAERSLAARAHAAAREIEEAGLSRSRLAARLMERSLRALSAPSTRPARPEVRETFKRAIEESGAIRRREVLVLNLAEALFRHLEDRNEALPPLERLTLEQIERLSLVAAQAAATEFTRDTLEQGSLPGLERRTSSSRATVRRRVQGRVTRLRLAATLERALAKESTLEPERLRTIAEALATLSRWFAEEVCLRGCREACLTAPAGDGRSLFYSETHPAGLEASPSLTGPPNFAAGAGAQRQLRRRLDGLVEDLHFVLDGLLALGCPSRREVSSALRRLREIDARLQSVRIELESIEEDPAAIYSWIEETHSLAEELQPLFLRLVGAALTATHTRCDGDSGGPVDALDPRLRRALRSLGLHAAGAGVLREAARRLGGIGTLARLLELSLGHKPRGLRSALEGGIVATAPGGRSEPLFSPEPGPAPEPKPGPELHFDGERRSR